MFSLFFHYLWPYFRARWWLFVFFLQEIYGLGGRKIAFQNAGLLGCLPSSRSGTKNGACAEKPSALARLHNMALAKALKELESSLPGFKYAIFDYYKAISQRTDNPSEYGRLWLLHIYALRSMLYGFQYNCDISHKIKKKVFSSFNPESTSTKLGICRYK